MKKIFIFILLLIFVNNCKQRSEENTPVKTGRESPLTVSILLDNKPIYEIKPEAISSIPYIEFKTGLSDVQRGVPLIDLLKAAGIHSGTRVVIEGKGSLPLTLSWQVIENKENAILLAETHRHTYKIISANRNILNRDDWVRHVYKINVETD